MGCLQTCNRSQQAESSDALKILQAINLGSVRRLKSLLDYFTSVSSIEKFDTTLVDFENLSVNALGLALLKGKPELFKLLLDYKCNLQTMEEILEGLKISPIHYLCIQGYLEVLRLYFPHYLANSYKCNVERTYSIALTHNSTITCKAFPVHTAAHYGNVEIIHFFYEYFIEQSRVPEEFDINALEENTGENCALIACREGYFNLVKFLHQNCKTDFKILNDFKENAILVAVAGMNKKPDYAYIDIVEYLVEEIKVDLKYMYEEVLLLANFPELIQYIEKKLGELGIEVTKNVVEKNVPSPNKVITYDVCTKTGLVFTNSFLNGIEGLGKSLASTISNRDHSIDSKSIDNFFKYE